MNVSPVFARELCSKIEIQRLRRERWVAALVAGVILIVVVSVARWVGINLPRLVSVLPIASIAPLFLLVVGLTRGGNLLATERREGTLPLLLLTHLTGLDIAFGKLLQALVIEATLSLAMLPALVLPLIAVGFQFGEFLMVILGCMNIMFFGLALGLFTSIFSDSAKATSWCLLLLLPLLAYSTPFAAFLPRGWVLEYLAPLQWLNPCAPLTHVQTAAGGFRPAMFWVPLLMSHGVAWGLVALTGHLLPYALRWQAGVNAGARSLQRRGLWSARQNVRSRVQRARLLNRNAILWLRSRECWPTAQVWVWLAISSAGMGWIAWLGRGAGGPVYFVIVMAAPSIWHIILLAVIPGEASRHLVEDRNSGALEMILCTPVAIADIVRGQWLSLAHRYVPPLAVVMFVDAVLMICPYLTSGFGGMLEPEDRAMWLAAWSAGILVLPLWLVTLCWVAMRRSLFVRNAGEASGIAFVEVVLATGATLWASYGLMRWSGWNLPTWLSVILFAAIFVMLLSLFAWHARRVFWDNLRHAATTRYCTASSTARSTFNFCSPIGRPRLQTTT